jgi:hypothetical protein
MARAIYKLDELRNFISTASERVSLPKSLLAVKLGISSRTLRDWQRGKYIPNQEILTRLSEIATTPLPKPQEIREDWWSGRVNGPAGARARYRAHGCSYTLAQRQKGGSNSQINRRLDPEYYRSLGCTIPRDFTFPDHYSNELAEFVGVLLGDGGIQPNQVCITLNSTVDKEYSGYVSQLIFSLFKYQPTLHDRFPTKALTILISGKKFTEQLTNLELRVGNKVKQQVGVPSWICQNSDFSRWCLRGLMDTDGGIFTHTYKVHGKSYAYLKANFTNASQPLLDFVYQTLRDNGFHPCNKQPHRIWLYSQVEARRYLEVIGSSNQRLLRKLK